MRILLLGREGQVAWELRRTLVVVGDVVAVDRRTPGFAADLADMCSLRRIIREIKPDLVVNAAAYTAVDKAERETDLAWRINAEAPGVIATEVQRIGAGLIHYSTDYVFDGASSGGPYLEDHETHPQNVYGQSKLAGEEAIRSVGAPYLILRAAWVYAQRGHNFLLTMLRLLRERDVVRVVDDQQGAPTWSRLIAEATALLVMQCRRGGTFSPGELAGTYHLTCAGETTWYGFAQQIKLEALARGLLPDRCAELEAIRTTSYPTPAKRPVYSVLAGEKLSERFGVALPRWDRALKLCLEELPRFSTG